eukprot:CFRG0547T1
MTVFDADEAAQYDRQIRLWGAEAQQRMQNSHILVQGVLALSNEVLKNVVLAGVGSVTLLDHKVISQSDLTGQFLVDPAMAVGQKRAEAVLARLQALNPRVRLIVDTGNVDDKPDEFFKNFGTICLTDTSHATAVRINDLARNSGVLFFWGGLYGQYGFFFEDLGEKYEYVQSHEDKEGETVNTAAYATYSSLGNAYADNANYMAKSKRQRPTWLHHGIQILFRFRDEEGRMPSHDSDIDMEKVVALMMSYRNQRKLTDDTLNEERIRHLGACSTIAFSPAAAIVGGVLGQEILKVASRKDKPHNNFLYFDGIDGSMKIECYGQA